MVDDQDCIQGLQEEVDHNCKEARLEDLMVVEVHDLQEVDNLDIQAGILEDSCMEQEDRLEDHLDELQDELLDELLDDHLDAPLDDQDAHLDAQDVHLDDLQADPQDDQLVDPLGVVEVGRADQDQVQAPDLRTLHCSWL